MKSFVALFVLLALTHNALSFDAGCGYIQPPNNVTAFNILPFTKTQVFTVLEKTGNVSFSFCTAQVPNCNTTNTTNVFGTYNTSTGCNNIAESFGSNFTYNNPSDPESGFTITYPPVPINTLANYTLYVTFNCSESDTEISDSTFTATINGDDFFVHANSYYGCAYLDLGQFIAFLAKYEIIFVVLFVLFGIFLIFFGLKMFNITIFMVTAVVGTFASGSLFYMFTSYSTSGGLLWVVFFIALIIGCTLGYLAVKFEKVGFFGLGFCLGGVGGMFLFNGVILPFLSTSQGQNYQWLFYVVLSVLAVIGGLLALWIWRDVIIIATSVIGSYMMVRSLSVVIGGFPPETAVAAGTAKFSGVAYAYLVAIVILAIVGVIYQERQKKLREDQNEEANMENIYKNMA